MGQQSININPQLSLGVTVIRKDPQRSRLASFRELLEPEPSRQL